MQRELTVVMMMFCLTLFCRAVDFSGRVVDAHTGAPLVGANVVLKGTTLGGVTSANGKFLIKRLKEDTYSLAISYAGYKRVLKDVDLTSNLSDTLFQMEVSNHDLGEVVVTATGTSQHLKMSPIQTEVYGKNELASVDATTIEEALNSLSPSVSFQPSIMGAYLSVNGMSKDYVLILVDGRKLAGDVSGNPDISRIDMQNVERIEVVKGASSTLYGSDAMGAVINIITKKGRQNLSVNGSARISAKGEADENINIHINKNRVKSSTSYFQRSMDGYQLSKFELKGGDTIATTKEVQSTYHMLGLNQQIEVALNKKVLVNSSISWYDKNLERTKTDYKYGYNYNDLNFNVGLKYLINKKDNISADYYNDSYESQKVYNQEYKTFKENDRSLSKKQNYQRLRVTSLHHLPKNNLLSLGSEATNDNMESVYLPHISSVESGDKSVLDMAFWAQDEWRIVKDFSLVAGLRYNIYDSFGGRLTPKAAICYSPNDWRFRLNYANGYKVPSLLELYYQYEASTSKVVGNTDLSPQLSNYGAFTVEYNIPIISVSATAYINRLNDMIFRKNISDQLTATEIEEGFKKKQIYSNFGEAEMKGIDLSLNFKPFKTTYLKLGYSYCSAEGVEEVGNDYQRIEKISENTATCQVGFHNLSTSKRFDMNIAGRYEDEKYFVDGNSDAYQIWNFNSSFRLETKHRVSITFKAGVRNIFDYVDDRPFGSNYGTIDPGRRVYVGLAVEINK